MWSVILTATLLVIKVQAGPLYFKRHDTSQDANSEEIFDSETLRKTICPDQAVSCPTDYTCCKLASGEWGCCPLKAVSMAFFLLLHFMALKLGDPALALRQVGVPHAWAFHISMEKGCLFYIV
jgi:hypothetical protein